MTLPRAPHPRGPPPVEEQAAENAVKAINQQLFRDDAHTTQALLAAHRALLELPELDPAVHERYHSSLTADAQRLGKLSQGKIRKSLERVNAELLEERMVGICQAAIESFHSWHARWCVPAAPPLPTPALSARCTAPGVPPPPF